MKKYSISLVLLSIFFFACSKSDSGGSGSSFQAKINGTSYNFNLETSHLLRSTVTNEKRLDFSGTSTDGTIKLVVTLGEQSSTGNGMSVKLYKIQLFNEDNPSTTEDESLDSDDGFITYGSKVGSNFVFGVYAEKGSMRVSACNESAKTISGTFECTLTDLNNNNVITISEGKFNNISYTVIN